MQADEMFYVGETPNLTFASNDSFPMENVKNPDLGISYCNSYLSSVTSSVQLLMLKVNCLDRDYDARIDSGSSHNFISQQIYEQRRKLQKGAEQFQVEQAAGYQLQVVLADGTTTQSSLRTRIKVKLDNGKCLRVQCNIVKTLAQQIVLGMPFLHSTNPQID